MEIVNNISKFDALYNSVYPTGNIPENVRISENPEYKGDTVFLWLVGLAAGLILGYYFMTREDVTTEKKGRC